MDGPQDRNISTEHQEKGDAKRPTDTLDRDTTGDETAENYKERPVHGEGESRP